MDIAEGHYPPILRYETWDYRHFTPAAESHGLWPWMNAPALGRDVAPLGRSLGATGFARGAPLLGEES
jgi:hypothetical protein